MTEKEKSKAILESKKQIVPIKRSFKEARKAIEERIEWQCLHPDRRAIGRELAMIIAEVELLPPDSLVRIDGNDLPAILVSEIYAELTHDHINFVIENLEGLNYRVFSMKTYIRTALYNSIFTLETAYDNMAKSDL